MWADQNSNLYAGDMKTGDRAATPAEETNWLAAINAQVALNQADLLAATNAKADSVIQYLVNHTPAECSAYVVTNVTNLATAVSLLQKMAMALCVLSKEKLR